MDWVEILQKTEDIAAIPAPFKSYLRLAGSTRAGGTVRFEAELPGVTDVRYFLFADGYPLNWGPSSTYTLTADDAGKRIRCMVKAVGARDMPEAWSNVFE